MDIGLDLADNHEMWENKYQAKLVQWFFGWVISFSHSLSQGESPRGPQQSREDEERQTESVRRGVGINGASRGGCQKENRQNNSFTTYGTLLTSSPIW